MDIQNPDISELLLCLKRCRDRDDIELCLMQYDLPPFPAGRFLTLSDMKQVIYPKAQIALVPLDSLRGDAWVFCSHEKGVFQGDYRNLANVLTYLLWQPDRVVPVSVFRYKNFYVASDGGHRIYASYLLGLKEIKVSIEGEYQP